MSPKEATLEKNEPVKTMNMVTHSSAEDLLQMSGKNRRDNDLIGDLKNDVDGDVAGVGSQIMERGMTSFQINNNSYVGAEGDGILSNLPLD